VCERKKSRFAQIKKDKVFRIQTKRGREREGDSVRKKNGAKEASTSTLEWGSRADPPPISCSLTGRSRG
jgi:hypothetical protein